jgi:hypothetical protein
MENGSRNGVRLLKSDVPAKQPSAGRAEAGGQRQGSNPLGARKRLGGHPKLMGPKGPHQAGRVRVAASDATTGARSFRSDACLCFGRDAKVGLRRTCSCRPAGRESPDQRCVGPSGPEPHWRCGEGPVILGSRVREIVGEREASCMTRRAGRRSQSRNPTAVQSGNRSATPLGERPRREQSRATVCVSFSARSSSC